MKAKWGSSIAKIVVGQSYGFRTVLAEAAPYTKPDGTKGCRRWKCVCGVCGHTQSLGAHEILKPQGSKCLKCRGKVARAPNAAFKRVLDSYKASARKRGLKWALTESEVRALFASNCHYCGAEPSNIGKPSSTSKSASQFGREFLYSGLDRRKNSEGYTTENVVPCCKTCNWAKGKSSYDDYTAWLNRLVFHRSRNTSLPAKFSVDQLEVLNEVRDHVAANAKAKGFKEPPKGFSHAVWFSKALEVFRAAVYCSNQHAETSEFWEAARKGKLRAPCDKAEEMKQLGLPGLTCAEEEIADQIIRLLDTAFEFKVDVAKAVAVKAAFNSTRPHRHGGKLA